MEYAIRQHGGVIDKLIGDAIMAVFFSVPGSIHPAVRAALAAETMLSETVILSGEQKEGGKEGIRTDVGIHFGSLISGKKSGPGFHRHLRCREHRFPPGRNCRRSSGGKCRSFRKSIPTSARKFPCGISARGPFKRQNRGFGGFPDHRVPVKLQE